MTALIKLKQLAAGFLTAATNGLNIAPAGTVRLGGALDTNTIIDGGFSLVRNSGASTAIVNNTTGYGAYGTINNTTGGEAVGTSNTTSGDGAWGVYTQTTGVGAIGVITQTTGANANGKHALTFGTNAHGVYSAAFGAGSYSGYFLGDIFVGGTVVPSDKRLKENIKPIETALEEILKLEVVEFDKFSESDFDIPQSRDETDEERVAQTIKQIEKAIGRSFTDEELKLGKARIRKAQGHRTGVIAQQLQEVFPQFVNTSGEFLAIDESGINYMLLKAVQELTARVIALEGK